MKILSIILSVLLFVNISVGKDDAKSILNKVQKKYESIKDITAQFSQNIVFGVSKMEQTFEGTLYMKKGNKYRIELEHQTIVTDGKSVWSYYHTTKQVVIDKYKDDSNSFSPDKVLTNVPKNYYTFFIGNENLFNKKTAVIKLTPKEEKSLIKSMKVWIDLDEYLMRKIEVIDVSDNVNTYLVSSIKINSGISENRFNFEVPADVETVDLR